MPTTRRDGISGLSLISYGQWLKGAQRLQVLSRSNVASAMAIEIMRLNVPVAAVFRRAARDTTTGGVFIPEGGNVIINVRKVRIL